MVTVEPLAPNPPSPQQTPIRTTLRNVPSRIDRSTATNLTIRGEGAKSRRNRVTKTQRRGRWRRRQRSSSIRSGGDLPRGMRGDRLRRDSTHGMRQLRTIGGTRGGQRRHGIRAAGRAGAGAAGHDLQPAPRQQGPPIIPGER